jgi:hypothetical protein
VGAGNSFTYSVGAFFSTGYPGNRLTFSATENDYTTPLPAWLAIDPSSGLLSGTAPADTTTIGVVVTATDLNGMVLQDAFNIRVDTAGAARVTGIGRQAMQYTDEFEESELSSMTVFPNPIEKHQLTVEFYRPVSQEISMSVINMQGVEVMEMVIEPGSSTGVTVELPQLPKGVYVLKAVDADGKVATRKVMIAE